MKRILPVVICLVLLLGMVGCGGKTSSKKRASRKTEPTATQLQAEEATEEVTQETQPEETQPATEPATQATTQATQPQEQEQPTQPETPTTWYMTQNTSDAVASISLPASTKGGQMEKITVSTIYEYLDSRYPGTFSLTATSQGVSVDTADATYYLDVTCTQTYASDGFASYLFEGYYSYKPAASPTRVVFTLNVNTTSNMRVMVKPDQTIDENFYNVFLPYAQSSLDAFVGGAGIASVEDLCPMDALVSGLKYSNTGFYAYYTQEGMVVIYPVPGALGDYQKALVPYSAI